jgi:hypothetical protein
MLISCITVILVQHVNVDGSQVHGIISKHGHAGIVVDVMSFGMLFH